MEDGSELLHGVRVLSVAVLFGLQQAKVMTHESSSPTKTVQFHQGFHPLPSKLN